MVVFTVVLRKKTWKELVEGEMKAGVNHSTQLQQANLYSFTVMCFILKAKTDSSCRYVVCCPLSIQLCLFGGIAAASIMGFN